MSTIDDENKNSFEKLKLDYEKTTAYFQSLHDTRFKLLGLLPLISSASIFVAPTLNNKFEIVFGLLGIVIMIGITIYDQRNNMIYDRLTRRAAFLEMKMGFPPLPTDTHFGGPFSSRPHRRTIGKIPIIWHDLALAIVYSASFAVWTFIFFVGVYHRWGMGLCLRMWVVTVLTILYFAIYLSLASRNDIDNKSIHAAVISESSSRINSPESATPGRPGV